ncbi:MAG: hypothetical protein M1830_007718, partial [Pleopsidium flavum]
MAEQWRMGRSNGFMEEGTTGRQGRPDYAYGRKEREYETQERPRLEVHRRPPRSPPKVPLTSFRVRGYERYVPEYADRSGRSLQHR